MTHAMASKASIESQLEDELRTLFVCPEAFRQELETCFSGRHQTRLFSPLALLLSVDWQRSSVPIKWCYYMHVAPSCSAKNFRVS